MKGVRCKVYRPAFNEEEKSFMEPTGLFERNLLTDRFSNVTLCGTGVPEEVEPTEDAPALILLRRELKDGEQLSAYPPDPEGGWYCSGGNYIQSWDLRSISKYPIPVHDHLQNSP